MSFYKKKTDGTENRVGITNLEDIKGTRRQINYYHHLCSVLGIPYEVALQQRITMYNSRHAISDRIEHLKKLHQFYEIMKQNQSHALLLNWVLGQAIESSAREIHTRVNSNDGIFDVKKEHPLEGLVMKSEVAEILEKNKSRKNKNSFLFNKLIDFIKNISKKTKKN